MIVVDTSGILASKDESHPDHAAVAEIVADCDEELLLSPFVLAEADYMLASRLGHTAARELLDDVEAEAYQLVEFGPGDVASANGIIDRYEDLRIGIASGDRCALRDNPDPDLRPASLPNGCPVVGREELHTTPAGFLARAVSPAWRPHRVRPRRGSPS